MNTAHKIVNVVVKFTQQGLENIQTQINNLNNTTKDFNKSAKDASKNSKGLGDEIKKTGNAANNAGKQTEGASKSTRSFASSVGRAINIVAQFTIAMYAVQAVQKVFSFFTIDAARAAMEFESSLKSLQAIADVSSQDLETFKNVIFDVAGTTRFTASEIAELQKELSRLGFTTKEVVDSTEAVARFAEAIGSDLGAAAQFVGKQLQAFGLNASSAFEVTNSFTALINNSALSMETLATSMQYASSIASTLGVSIDETGALLGVLTNNGITASRAGTGLRQIFLELGADGGTLLKTLDDLAEQNITLSEAEELVGKRAAGALSVLVDQRKEIGKLIDAQESLVAATIASARQNSTFEGQVKGLNAAIDSILISLGSWISRTKIVIGLIELLGGGTTYRAFNVIDELGLSSQELKTASKNVESLEKILYDTQNTSASLAQVLERANLEEIFGVSSERAAVLAKSLLESAGNANDFNAMLGYLREMNAQIQQTEKATSYASAATKVYTDQVDELSQKALKGVDIDKERDSLLKQIANAQDVVTKKLADSSGLTEQEILNLEKLDESYGQLLNRLRNISFEPKNNTEETIKGFRELYEMQRKLMQATEEGDIPLAERLSAEYQEALQVLQASGLLGEYQKFVQRLLTGDLEFGGASQELLAKEIENSFRSTASYLEDQIKSGNITMGAASSFFYDEMEKAILLIDDPVLRAELEKVIANLFPEVKPEDVGKSEEERKKAIKKLIVDQSREIAEAGADAAFDATQRRLQAEQEAVDARYSYEEDRLQSLVNNNLITQAEYERKREQLERERIQKTNEIEKKQFESDKARALVDLAIDTAIAISSRGFEPIQSAIILAASAVQAGIISAQKFIPVQFEEGGMVQGRSHREGGVPFTVQGVGGYEMEGGEYIVNKKATAKYLPMLEQINSYGRVNNSMFKHFANGGLTGMEGAMGMGESARINAMLLQRLNQPIRAYVSERELMTKSNERINQKMKSRL